MYAGTPAAMRAFFLILQKQFPVEHSVKSPQDASVRAEVARYIPLSPARSATPGQEEKPGLCCISEKAISPGSVVTLS